MKARRKPGFFYNGGRKMVEIRQEKLCTNHYVMDVVKDFYNKRIRIDDYRGDMCAIIKKITEVSDEHEIEKVIIKARKEDFETLIQNGFLCEATINRYFLGSDLFFFCKYYQTERRRSDDWIKEDEIVENVSKLSKEFQINIPPADYQLRRMTENDAKGLATLYRAIFEVYPTPLHDPEYIKKTMNDGTIYFGYVYADEIVSAASAEVNNEYKNAELTDCATLVEHRKHGLMKVLLQRLEKELANDGIFCAYSIARSLSFGMNAALHQLDYVYRGRLGKNCYIFNKLEDMNVWVKDLSTTILK